MPLPTRITQAIALHLKTALAQTQKKGIATKITGTSPGGDATFLADALAEQVLADYIKAEGLNVSVYTEDRGLVEFGEGEPEGLLIVDPIDGTRPFNAGLPVSMVSVALAKHVPGPTFDDIIEGCLVELADDRILFAQGDKPPEIIVAGKQIEYRKNPNEDLAKMSWVFELAGRPIKHVVSLLDELIDRSSLTGGCFTFASSAYSISRVVEGTLGSFIDVGGWLLDAMLIDDEQAMGLFPYDIAAAYLIAKNAGCNITDFYGKPLIDVVLTDSSVDSILSCVVTSNLELHKEIMAYLKQKAEQVLAG